MRRPLVAAGVAASRGVAWPVPRARAGRARAAHAVGAGAPPLSPPRHDDPLARIRNLGIIAHIDAGKTTTTERMLMHAGVTARCGEVHDGNTVMDFLPQERERGITIKAAAITFGWRGHTVNLIDTPGHVDFTVEVERCMRVLDGAVALFDAVSGVEAQSETVWAQADRYGVPRVGFANKMDREGASYDATAASVEARLGATALRLHVPLGAAGAFAGVVDLLSLTAVAAEDREGRVPWAVGLRDAWRGGGGGGAATLRVPGRADGQGALSLPLDDVVAAARAARVRLLETLADVDDAVAGAYLAALDAGVDVGLDADGAPGLTPGELAAAVRRALARPGNRLLPLLAGSAYRYKGVPALLDAAVAFLPSPAERPPLLAARARGGGPPVVVPPSPTAPLAALAFKVQSHPTRGPLVFFRVYAGVLAAKMPLVNTTAAAAAAAAHATAVAARGAGAGADAAAAAAAAGAPAARERASKLLQILGEAEREVESVGAGHIGAAVGLKGVRTGDTLCLAGDPHAVVLRGVTLPQPVFTAALEVPGAAELKALEAALLQLTREDPSLVAATDEGTGQLLLSGMGELHLDISADRLRREFGVPVTLGRVQVAYRETVGGAGTGSGTFDRVVGGRRHWARVTVEVEPLSRERWAAATAAEGGGDVADGAAGDGDAGDGDAPVVLHNLFDACAGAMRVRVLRGAGGAGGDGADGGGGDAGDDGLRPLPLPLEEAVREGVAAAFGRGPALGCPLVGVCVRLVGSECEVSAAESSPAAVRAALARAVAAALDAAGVEVLEPVMRVEVVVPEAGTGGVLSDLVAHRRARIRGVGPAAAAAAVAAAAAASSSYARGGGALGGGGGGGGDGGGGARKTAIRAAVPLRGMVGYSTALRSATGGEGSFAMEFEAYAPVGQVRQARLVEDPLA